MEVTAHLEQRRAKKKKEVVKKYLDDHGLPETGGAGYQVGVPSEAGSSVPGNGTASTFIDNDVTKS
jgi:hypothetical protein